MLFVSLNIRIDSSGCSLSHGFSLQGGVGGGGGRGRGVISAGGGVRAASAAAVEI